MAKILTFPKDHRESSYFFFSIKNLSCSSFCAHLRIWTLYCFCHFVWLCASHIILIQLDASLLSTRPHFHLSMMDILFLIWWLSFISPFYLLKLSCYCYLYCYYYCYFYCFCHVDTTNNKLTLVRNTKKRETKKKKNRIVHVFEWDTHAHKKGKAEIQPVAPSNLAHHKPWKRWDMPHKVSYLVTV